MPRSFGDNLVTWSLKNLERHHSHLLHTRLELLPVVPMVMSIPKALFVSSFHGMRREAFHGKFQVGVNHPESDKLRVYILVYLMTRLTEQYTCTTIAHIPPLR